MNVAAHPGYKPAAAAAKKPLSERVPFAAAVNSKFIAQKKAGPVKRGVKIPTKPHASWDEFIAFSGGAANAHLNEKIGQDGSLTRDSHQGVEQEHIIRAALQEDRRL